MAGKADNNEVPDLNQLVNVKDHKPTLQTRPFCRAHVQQASNGPIAEVLCEILKPIVEEADKGRKTEVKSTEELFSQIKLVNEEILLNGLETGPFQKDGGLIVVSKDVKAHYPETDIDVASEEVQKETKGSDLDINVDTYEVALFLACIMTVKQIKGEGLTQLVHKRRFRKGTRP